MTQPPAGNGPYPGEHGHASGPPPANQYGTPHQNPPAGQYGVPHQAPPAGQYGGYSHQAPPAGQYGGTGHAPPAVTSTGLEPSVAGLLAYLFGWIGGLVMLLIERQHQPTRFHAAQSIVVFGALSVAAVLISGLSMIPLIGWAFAIVGLFLGPAAVVLWIILMVRAYQQTAIRLPLAADLADQIVAKAS